MSYKLERLEKAAALERKSAWSELLSFCTEWSAEEPLNPLPWQGIGDAQRKLGNPREAVATYLKGLDVAPPQPMELLGNVLGPLWYRLGQTYGELGETQNSIRAFNEAAQVDPGVADIWNDLGVAYCNLTPIDAKSASEAFRMAIKLDPTNLNSLKNLGIVYAMCDMQQGVTQVHQELSKLNARAARDFLEQANQILARH